MSLFQTSQEARAILEAFRKTGLRPNLWARAALGYSLGLDSVPDETSYDSKGSEFTEEVFFGDDKEVLLALLRQRHGKLIEPEGIGKLIKSHVERGVRHFNQEFERVNRRGDEFLIHILNKAVQSSSTTSATTIDEHSNEWRGSSYLIKIELGYKITDNKRIDYALNAPGSAPHIAIMGRNGTGKTRTALAIIEEIYRVAAQPPAVLIFDYAKGDIASNTAFARSIHATVCSLPTNTIPLAPLALENRDSYAIKIAARRFRDTISSVVNLGPIQKERCLQLMEVLYSEAGDTAPSLEDLVSTTNLMYEQEEWREDSLWACIREFGSFPIFRPGYGDAAHDFFSQSYIIDLHLLPESLRKLATFLVLDKLYTDIMAMEDAPLDSEGNRYLRQIIVIDEAHHFLPCKQPTLEQMVREVRSKGVALVMMSQSPDDFDQPKYNFAREIGLPIVFSCVLEHPKVLESVLGGNVDPRRLSQLPAGVALMRIPGFDAPIEVRAWQP